MDQESRQEYDAYIADAQRKVRMLQTESAYAGPPVNVSVPSGWHVKSEDYQLLPPQDEQERGSILEDYLNVGKIRGTVGRCTR